MIKANSFTELWCEIKKIKCREDELLFFRGHADKNYILVPSVLRSEEELKKEDQYYHDIMVECPEEFSKHEHLSNLAKMQHYGSVTRLLDWSFNPLIGMFMAVEDKYDIDGKLYVMKKKKSEILHHTSDKALMLSCLPLLTYDNKKELEEFCKQHTGVINDRLAKTSVAMTHLLHEIRSEFPAFETAIVGGDLLKSYLVITYRDTPRIKFQKGAFTVFGLGDEAKKTIQKESITEILIDKDAKKQILEDIALMGVDSSTVYPDLERKTIITRKLKLKPEQI